MIIIKIKIFASIKIWIRQTFAKVEYFFRKNHKKMIFLWYASSELSEHQVFLGVGSWDLGYEGMRTLGSRFKALNSPFSFFAAKKRNRKSSPRRLNPLKFHCLRWTKINSLRSDSIFVLTASTMKFLDAI